jgi:hypothetical protein
MGGGREREKKDSLTRSSALSNGGDIIRITTEPRDILLDPLERVPLVAELIVGLVTL